MRWCTWGERATSIHTIDLKKQFDKIKNISYSNSNETEVKELDKRKISNITTRLDVSPLFRNLAVVKKNDAYYVSIGLTNRAGNLIGRILYTADESATKYLNVDAAETLDEVCWENYNKNKAYAVELFDI